MVSAVMSLTKGNWLSRPTVAAKAVLPVPAGPSSRQVSKGFLSLVLTCNNQTAACWLNDALDFKCRRRWGVANASLTVLLYTAASETQMLAEDA